MGLGKSLELEDGGQLEDVLDLDLLQLEISVEHTVVELAEVGETVAFGQVLLLAVVDSVVCVNLMLVVGGHRVLDLLEVFKVRGASQALLKLAVITRLGQLGGASWVQMAEIVEEVLQVALSGRALHIGLTERVVNDLKGFPVRLGLQQLIHHFARAFVAVLHGPAMELGQPDLLDIH